MRRINYNKHCTDMTANTLFRIVRILSIGGIILAIYLLWEQATQPAIPPCTINSYINCDAVISGAVAKTFGIPTPLYGLVGYLFIFTSTLAKKRKILLTIATFGLGFCLWIAYVELFQLHVICPICIGCQLIMISVFTLSIILNRIKSEKKNL
jgi:uncharacterized membrane protein